MSNRIELKSFLNLMNKISGIKMNLIIFRFPFVYGLDDEMSMISYIKMEDDINYRYLDNLVVRKKDLSDFTKSLFTIDDIIVGEDVFGSYIAQQDSNRFYLMTNPYSELNYVDHCIGIINTYSNIPPLFIIEDLKQIESFNNVMDRKTSDGNELIKINGYFLSIYKSLLPVNKNDGVGIKVWKTLDEYPTIIVNYSITKKKVGTIELWLKSCIL